MEEERTDENPYALLLLESKTLTSLIEITKLIREYINLL